MVEGARLEVWPRGNRIAGSDPLPPPDAFQPNPVHSVLVGKINPLGCGIFPNPSIQSSKPPASLVMNGNE